MEGYRTTAVSTQTADAATTNPVIAAPIFRSAQDINFQIFKSGTVSPFCSPKKRDRFQYEDLAESTDAEDTDVEMGEAASVQQSTESSDTPVRRRLKPLRKLKLQASPAKAPTNPSSVIGEQRSPQATSVDPQHDPFLY